MPKRKVLVTGAAGYIASQLLPSFLEVYELAPLDITDTDRSGKKVKGVVIANIIDPDREGFQHYFEGVDTVVHLAYRRRGRTGEPLDDFASEKLNVEMAYNVYRTAHETGVRRVVVASSNHAADWYEHNLIHQRKMEMVDPYALPLSDNFYGWAKATNEHMGFVFASGAFGRKLEVVLIRIGGPREQNFSRHQGDIKAYKRGLGAYISQRDLCQLFIKAIEACNIENEHGIPWQVVYGISGNTRSFWSITNARRVLGYEPQDDSEVRYAKDIQSFLTGPEAQAGPGRVGD